MCAEVGRDDERDKFKRAEKLSKIKPKKAKEEDDRGGRLIDEDRAFHCDHTSSQKKTNKDRNYALSDVHTHSFTANGTQSDCLKLVHEEQPKVEGWTENMIAAGKTQ